MDRELDRDPMRTEDLPARQGKRQAGEPRGDGQQYVQADGQEPEERVHGMGLARLVSGRRPQASDEQDRGCSEERDRSRHMDGENGLAEPPDQGGDAYHSGGRRCRRGRPPDRPSPIRVPGRRFGLCGSPFLFARPVLV
jgi:hypothetical protein